MAKAIDPSDYVIHEAYDSGTANFKIATQPVQRGELPHTASDIATLGKWEAQIQPQIVGFIVEHGVLSFQFGVDLEFMLSRRVEVPYLFERLKMCFFASDTQKDNQSTVRRRLEEMRQQFPDQVPVNATEDWLMVMLLTNVRKAVMAWEQETYSISFGWTADQVANIERRVFVLTPEISTHSADDAMMRLVKLSGFTKENKYLSAVPVSETESAAAWIFHELSQRQDGILGSLSNTPIVTIDGGGMTVNATLSKATSTPGRGVGIKLEGPCRKQGAACGAERVTIKAIQFAKAALIKHFGTVQNFLGGKSEAALERKISVDFESFKTVTFMRKPDHSFKLYGKDAKWFEVTYTSELVKVWFDNEVISKVIELLDKIIEPTSPDDSGSSTMKIIMCAGGMFASKYILERLRARYGADGFRVLHSHGDSHQASDHAGVKGCLARSVPGPVQIPDTFSLGISEGQPFDRDKHQMDRRPRKKQGQEYVENCWRPLLEPSQLAGTSSSLYSDVWQTEELIEDDPTVERQIYCSSRTIATGDSVMSSSGVLSQGIDAWRNCVSREVPVEELRKYKSRKMLTDDGKTLVRVYEVWFRLRTWRYADFVSLEWHRAPPSFHPRGRVPEERSEKWQKMAPRESEMITLGPPVEVYDHSFTPFIQRNILSRHLEKRDQLNGLATGNPIENRVRVSDEDLIVFPEPAALSMNNDARTEHKGKVKRKGKGKGRARAQRPGNAKKVLKRKRAPGNVDCPDDDFMQDDEEVLGPKPDFQEAQEIESAMRLSMQTILTRSQTARTQQSEAGEGSSSSGHRR